MVIPRQARRINTKKSLLLHTCCAPCLTSVFEALRDLYEVVIFWHNPNIYPIEEHEKRLNEVEKYAKTLGIKLITAEGYKDDSYFWNQLVKEYSNEPEGGKRCQLCIKYRLLNAARYAKDNGYNFFATTLTVSPYKNTEKINKIGREISAKLDVAFLEQDFKKNNGYKRSIELCREHNIYRQKYCGCSFSFKQ